MDIVYLYNKKYVQWRELLYSIRSIEKFYPDHGTIWIIGDKPEWIQNVKYISHPSQQTNSQVNKTNNINERLFLAANHPEVSDDFIWMADDYCIVNPVTDSYIKKNIISRGNYDDPSYRKILEGYYKGSNHPYKKLLKQTLELANRKGYSTWDYEAHCPFVFNKEKLLKTFNTFGKTGFIISTAYGNMHYKDPLVDTFRGFDSPVNIRFLYRDRRDPHTREWAKEMMENLYYINYDDFGLSAGLKKVITELFPNKGRYELGKIPKEKSLALPQHKARKLRPIILSCDNRLDAFKIFVESYEKIAHSMLQPVILAGYNNPEKRQEYDELLQQLNPYKIIEQTNHYKDEDPTEVLNKTPKRWRRLNYINIQKIMTKDFPRIALENSEEDVIFMEDDSFFSNQFPETVGKVSQYLQEDCDFITLYSPTMRYTNKGKRLRYDIIKKITDNGYTTNPHLLSNDFIHAIDGSHYYGNVCVAFSRKVLTSLYDNWKEIELSATAWDDRWGHHMVQKSFRAYATRLSYVQHQHGYSILNDEHRKISTRAFHSLTIPEKAKDIHFKIIVPVYNAENWISKNIKSIQEQDYINYEAVIVDDCSTDNTYDVVFKLIKDDKRFTLIRNGKNGGAMSSTIIGISASNAKDEDIILRIDGDDWLARADALSIIKKTYDTKNCLMTYGSYLDEPVRVKGSSWGGGGKTVSYTKECIIKNNFREHIWQCPPPRTFKYHLWKRIKDSDFRDTDGEYYSASSDIAMMFPILELAGMYQAAIPEYLYIYNQNNPMSDHIVNYGLQPAMETRIREKKKYMPINKSKMLRPFILTCDMRLDMFRKFIESYKTVAHAMLPPIVLAGFYDPEKREEYNTLIQELNPHVVIEQPNYIDDDEVDIEIFPTGGHGLRTTDPRYFNIQKIVIKDFPEIALKYSNEDIIWIEDDAFFSSQFPQAIKRASEHLQLDSDIITLYSQLGGWPTKESLPSDDFAHAVSGYKYHGTVCIILSLKIVEAFRDNWEEMEVLSTAWDHRWAIYAEKNNYRIYATRKSYVKHLDGDSALGGAYRPNDFNMKTFVE